MSKSRTGSTPRRKRLRRPARLHAARAWLPTYKGKNVVRGYAKWFGVDAWCAVIELRMPDELPEGYGTWWDDDFATIAGFTSGGAPVGTPVGRHGPQPGAHGIESCCDAWDVMP